MNTPFISFIVPAFNCAELLPLCVESILRAELDDFEIVIVDDGSTDGATPSLCDELSREHGEIVTIHHAKNEGVGAARDTAIRTARGEYIFCVDSDDQIEPEAVRDFVSRRDEWRGVACICFNHLTDCGGQTIPVSPFSLEGWQTVDEMLDMMPGFCPDVMWQHMFRRESLSQSQVRVPHLISGEDSVFVAQVMLLSEDIYVCRDPLYRYFDRKTAQNLSAGVTLAQMIEKIETIRETILPILQKDRVSAQKKRMIERYRNVNFMASIAHSSADEFRALFAPAEGTVRYGGYREAVKEISNYWARILTILRSREDRSLFVCPAGITGVGFVEKLLMSGIPVAGLLDNYRKSSVPLRLSAQEEFVCAVFPLRCLTEMGGKDKTFVAVASLTQNAEMIRRQLEGMGFCEGESVLYL